MLPGLALRFRLKFEPELLPSPAPKVSAVATVVLRFPNVPSVLAPEELAPPPFHRPQLPTVALVARDAVVSAANWVDVGLVAELNVSQPAMSVAAGKAAGTNAARQPRAVMRICVRVFIDFCVWGV